MLCMETKVANWGRAFTALGTSLQRFAEQRLDREERDINAMRIEAVRKLEMQHDEEILNKRNQADRELFGDKQKWDLEREAAANAAAESRQKADWEHDEKMQKTNLGAQERLFDRKSLADSIEQENRNYTTGLTDIQQQRAKLQQSMAEKQAEGFADPAGMQGFKDMLDDLDRREQLIQQSHVITLKRLNSGGYGKPEVLTPEQVRQIIGEKPSNDELAPAAPADPKQAAGQEAARAAAAESRQRRESGEPDPAQPEGSGRAYGAYGGIQDAVGGAAQAVGDAYGKAMTRGGQPQPEPQAAAQPQQPLFSESLTAVQNSMAQSRARMGGIFMQPKEDDGLNELFPSMAR